MSKEWQPHPDFVYRDGDGQCYGNHPQAALEAATQSRIYNLQIHMLQAIRLHAVRRLQGNTFWEVIMFKDRMIVWFLEYVFGGTLVIVPLASQFFRRFALADTYLWTARFFVACLGVILISCASSMRQRMLLAKRIDKLAEQISAEAKGQTGRN